MVLQYYMRIVQRLWWFITVCTLLALSISLGISYTTTPIYRASASLIVYPNASLTSSRDVVTSLDTLDKRSITSTYEDILNSNRVFQETVQGLGIDAQIASAYSRGTLVQEKSNTIELFVEGPDPRLAAALVNGIGQNSINYIKGMYQVFDIAFLDQAAVPTQRVRPKALRDGVIAAGVGLLIGVFLAILAEQMRVPLETLRRRAITDRLSSVYTGRYFRRLLEQEIARSPLEPLSLGLVELEGLHDLIDALPEAGLSDLLHKVAAILRNQLRGNDVIGRWNETTFALLLPSTPGSAATRTLERIRQALLVPVRLEATGEDIALNPCIGLTERESEDEASSELIRKAEIALEKARQSERKTLFYSRPG